MWIKNDTKADEFMFRSLELLLKSKVNEQIYICQWRERPNSQRNPKGLSRKALKTTEGRKPVYRTAWIEIAVLLFIIYY